jgi:chemotaxis receptor (MCP) glutamine deamidase CheD
MPTKNPTALRRNHVETVVGSASISVAGIGAGIVLFGHEPESVAAHALLPSPCAQGRALSVAEAWAECARSAQEAGADLTRLRWAAVGGAVPYGCRSALGDKNAAALARLTEELAARDLGGRFGRAASFDSATGEVRVRCGIGEERVVGNLRD